jgi:hypothetical protein
MRQIGVLTIGWVMTEGPGSGIKHEKFRRALAMVRVKTLECVGGSNNGGSNLSEAY